MKDLAAIKFGLAINHDFDDQSCALYTIYPRLLTKAVEYRLQTGRKFGVTGALSFL
jgi:hypothetical protein